MQITVVIPLFNKQHFILQSILSVLQQKNVDLEVLIIDDGSSDKSLEVINSVSDSRIRVFRQNNLGPSAARNRGMWEAKYPLIAFLDGDDFWAPTKLFDQSSFLQTHPEFSAVYCQALRVDVNGNMIYRKPFGFGIRDEDFLIKNLVNKPVSPALGSTLMIKTDVLKKMDGFDERIFNGEDTDLELRLAQAGFKQHMLSKSLVFIRFDGSSLSHSFDEERWAVSYRSHLLIYEKLQKNHPPEVSEEKALNKILNVHLRQFIYYLFIGKKEAESDLRARIIESRKLLDKNSRDFYTQIEFFTPLIYHNDGWLGLERFIDRVLIERNIILPNSENVIRDDLIKIKAIVWCAGQGGDFLKVQAWKYLLSTCGRNPQLLFGLNFWQQAARLLAGNQAIWINVKWHQLIMKF